MSAFCSQCGNTLSADDKFCQKCGRATAAPNVTPAGSVEPTAPPAPAETSGKAVASLVCGLLVFIPLAFVAAIILGHIAL